MKLFGLILLLLMIIIIASGLYLSSKYNVSLSDGKLFVKNNFSLNPATNNEILEYNSKAQFNIDILHYEIHIDLKTKENKIIGNTIITGVPKEEGVEVIELNFLDGFSISGVSCNNVKSDYLYEDDKIKIKPSETISDTFVISVSYEGEPENLGFGSFNFTEHNGKPFVYTLNEPIFASTWFPCNDLPVDKVLMDIYITNDSSMVSVSNGNLQSVSLKGERKTYHWKTVYPISTYLISIYSANYSYYNDIYVAETGDSMKIDYYILKEDLDKAKRDFTIHPKAIKYFSHLFGEYPFIKEKYGVAEFLWNFGAMEHQTISGIGKNFISGNQFFTGMLVHELAHQWWGNAVTLTEWKDIWLNEGFSTYSEALYWEQESGFSALKSTMRSFLTNFEGTTLYNPEKLFHRIVYNKGAWVLHMLRKEIGNEMFFTALKNYYEKYKYKNVTTYDFKNLVEELTGKDLTRFFNQWVFEGEGKIELEYKFNSSLIDSNYSTVLTITQIQDGYDIYHFPLEIDYYTKNQKKIRAEYTIDRKTVNINFLSDRKVNKIDLNPDNWLAAEIIYTETP